MSIRNKVTLIGRTGKEVEVFTYENGNLKASVSLATSDYYTNQNGEKVEQTEWHNLVAFGKVAEIMQKYVEKGKEIAIEGKVVNCFHFSVSLGYKTTLTSVWFKIEKL